MFFSTLLPIRNNTGILNKLIHEQNNTMNSIVHFELPTDNMARAGKFYQDVFGWQVQDMPEMKYAMAITTETDQQTQRPKNPGAINGGMFHRSADLPVSVVTIQVPDIDAAAEKLKVAGGTVVRPKVSVGDMGFIAYFKDTEGNVVGLWQNAKQ